MAPNVRALTEQSLNARLTMEWGSTLARAAKSDLGKIASSPKYSVLCQSYVGEPGNGIPAKKLPNEGVLGMECSRDARNIVRRLEAGSGRSGNRRFRHVAE